MSADPQELAGLLHSCVKRWQRLADDELGAYGLSMSRAKLLGALDGSGACHQAALATTFDLAPRTVTELVDALERDGLVERRPDPADRRARLVHLTEAGRAAVAHVHTIMADLLDQAFGGLDAHQLDEFAAVLRLIDVRIGRVPAAGSTT